MDEKMKPFRVETTVDASREVVWHALTTPSIIKEWFGWDYEGLEGEIRFIFVEHADPVPPDRIELGLGQEFQLADGGPGRTVVRVVLPGSLDEAGWEDTFDGIEEGWRAFLEQLRFMFARGARDRRTLHLAGTTTPAEAIGFAKELGGQGVWHSSRFQLMLTTADGWLIGVLGQSPLDDNAAGSMTLQVTTYGLADDTFAVLRDTAAARWAALAKEPTATP